MRSVLLIFLAAAFGLVVPARAQTYLITATGTYSGGLSGDSPLPDGAFTFTETFNVATATLTSSSSTIATYADPDGTSSLTYNGLTVTGIDPQIQITSDEVIGGEAIYGFEFYQPLPAGGPDAGYTVQLFTGNPSDAPSISLTSLNNLQTAPISDFANNSNLTAYNDGNGNSFGGGKTTSYSVQIEAAPEPTAIALSILAASLFLCLRVRQRHVSHAA